MPRKSSSLLESSENEKVEYGLSLSDNSALQDTFRRIENDGCFSLGIPKMTNYDDYVYPDCGYPDNGNN